jgi:metal-responsive CopG/Arc/MetJ family transcriptional regulator
MDDEEKNKVLDANTGASRLPITITLPDTLIEAIEHLAKLQRRNRSNMIEVLVCHGLVAEASGREFQRRKTD